MVLRRERNREVSLSWGERGSATLQNKSKTERLQKTNQNGPFFFLFFPPPIDQVLYFKQITEFLLNVLLMFSINLVLVKKNKE